MTTLLILGYVWPEPRSSAAGARMMELIRLFRAQGWQIHFASPAQPSEHQADLQALGVESHVIQINDSRVDRQLQHWQPNVVIFDRFMLEEQFGWRVAQQCPDAIRILETSDLHLLRHARQEAVRQSREVTKSDFRSERALREVAAIYRCDLSLIISEYEMQLLQQEFSVPPALLHYLPFMLGPPREDTPDFHQRQHFISIGNFRHAPNWDAVLWLQQSLWPRIRKALPDAQLHIYGAYPPPKATALHRPQHGFQVLGWAKDAGEVMQQARVCLAPLRFGAGLKGKLADAMSCGTPSITTTVGAEAMAGDLPWPGAIADDESGFVSQAIAVYQDPHRWHQAQATGHEILRQRFAREPLGAALLQRIEQLRDDIHSHREANFTGAMLHHHQHRSTQYMAQWIEAKNKLAQAGVSGDEPAS